MHIMFIPSWYSSKENPVHGSFFKEQALALQDKNIKITIAYNEILNLKKIYRISKEKIGLIKSIEDDLTTYRYRNFNYLPKNSNMFYVFNKRMDRLYKKIVEDEGKIDLIHCQSSFWAGISAAYISKKYGIPLIITEHSSLERAIYVRESYKSFIKDSYLAANKLIAVGNGLKNEMENFCGRKDIEVIHNMIDLDKFYLSNKIDKTFKFFSLAFLEGEKGMDVLIKSFAKFFINKDFKLLIGGEGSQLKYLKKMSNELGISNQVEFLGALSREGVAKNMSECDCFVLASKYETFGVVYIEALASGKPVIGVYNGGAEEIINDKNGIIVKKDSVEDLGNAMIYISNNIDSYNKEYIRNNCMHRFSKDKITNEIIALYEKVLDQNSVK